jgi:hypothetical protein
MVERIMDGEIVDAKTIAGILAAASSMDQMQ